MVTCNVCRANKDWRDMHPPFRYVCEDCWNDKLEIAVLTKEGKYEFDKDLLY